MKKLVQNTGVRKWYGDEWITIQDELNAVIEGHFGTFAAQFILSGGVVTDTSVSAGLIFLNHADGFKVCRLAAAVDLVFPCYLKPVKTEQTRLYLDGATKPVSYTYSAEISATNEGGYLELKADNTTPRFTDVIQDATHRFVTDTEKATYAGQAASAVNTIRGGIAESLDTLEKLRASVQAAFDNLPETVGVETIYATLRGNVDEALDTMEEIVAYIDGLSYLPEYQGKAELAGATIDWTGKPELYKQLLEDTLVDANNLIVGKTIGLKASGAFNLTFTSKFKKAFGSPDPNPGSINYIQMKCIDDTSGSEIIIYSVIFITI